MTKIGHLSFTSIEHEQAENFRKMLLSMIRDVRIILVKLADRLHIMRTLEFHAEDKRRSIAQETLDIYAPFAHRLGIGVVKWELEDLAFKHLEPEAYRQIEQEMWRRWPCTPKRRAKPLTCRANRRFRPSA